MLVLGQPFAADGAGGVCSIDLSFKSCLVLLNTLSMIIHGIHMHSHTLITHHRPVQDAGPVTMKVH